MMSERKNLIESITIGLGASFMVPLFLNMISSNLIEQIRGSQSSPGDPLKYFVLAGFCLVAAISSRAFISTLSDRVMKELKETEKKTKATEEKLKQVETNIAPILEKDTEIEQSDEVQFSIDDTFNKLTEEQQNVLKAMSEGNFVFRSIAGISRDTGLPRDLVHHAINELISNGLVSQYERAKGPRWVITLEGRRAIYDSKPIVT